MARRLVRVAIVEDDVYQRELATLSLEGFPDIEVLGAYASGREIIDALRPPAQVDVVVVDLGLPDMTGANVVRELKQLPKPPEAVVLTAQSRREEALDALKAGASCYLLKGTHSDLPNAIRIAADGGSQIAPAIARYLLDEVRVTRQGSTTTVPLREAAKSSDEPGAPAGQTLTRRERDVLELLAKGATYEDTARILGISLGTVQSHVKSLYRKLEVSSKAEAAAEAVRRGLANT